MLNYIVIWFLRVFRPLLGPASCKFPIGCTDYAIEQLKEHNLFKALWLSIKRLLACNPFKKIKQ